MHVLVCESFVASEQTTEIDCCYFFFFFFLTYTLSPWVLRDCATFWTRLLLAVANDFIKQVLFVFRTEKILIKAVRCSQLGSAVTWHYGICYLIGCLPAAQGGKA